MSIMYTKQLLFSIWTFPTVYEDTVGNVVTVYVEAYTQVFHTQINK